MKKPQNMQGEAGPLISRGSIDLRVEGDRRKAGPFGIPGPWLTTGKMGGLIFTDRRKALRRAADRVTGGG